MRRPFPVPLAFAHNTDECSWPVGGSVSFNTWQPSWAQRTVFGRAELFFDGSSADRTVSSEAHLHAIISAVVSEVLSPTLPSPNRGRVPGVCVSSSGAACVSEFFQHQLSLRWSPLLDLTSKHSAYRCATSTHWRWESIVPTPLSGSLLDRRTHSNVTV